MNACELFEETLRQASTRPALITGIGRTRRVVTFEEFDRRVDAVNVQLGEHGLRAGARILLAVPLSVETYIVMLALLKAGLVIMHIDPAHGSATVLRILRKWPPDAVIASKPIMLLGSCFAEVRRIPRRFTVGGHVRGAVRLDLAPVATGDNSAVHRADADPAILSFTSGSTGLPKAILRTHGFLRRQIEILNRIAHSSGSDVDLVTMPMFVLFNLANGVTSVLPACSVRRPGRADSKILLLQLQAERATRMLASPALLERLADHCLLRKRRIPELRCISTGGGPVGPNLPQRLRACAPKALVRSVYGSTEAEPIACIDDNEVSLADRMQTREGAGLLVGAPVRGCEVRIIASRPGEPLGPYTSQSFAKICLAAGEPGEIVVSGGHVIRGYADAARNRANKIRVQDTVWHRTGDAGYFDAAGRLWLVGRCAAALEDYRGAVYPFQVEYAVSAVRGVRRAALVEQDGDRVLVLETSSSEFRNHCADAARCVARFDIDRILTVLRIPVDRRHDAKVDYPALARMLEGRAWRWRSFIADAASRLFTHCRDGCLRVLATLQSAMNCRH